MLKSSNTFKSALLVGGTSTIGLAIIRELAHGGRLNKLILAGRPSDMLTSTLDALSIEMPGTIVRFVDMDLTSTGTLAGQVAEVIRINETDLMVLAAGVLPPKQSRQDQVLDAAKVNYLGPLEVCSQAVESFKSRGKGTIVIMSSVAAIRKRSDNYLYGSTKAGLDFWARGAAESLRSTAVRIMVVRPGMVETRMSRGVERAPLTCRPQDVASAVSTGLAKGTTVVWVPGKIKIFMTLLNMLPLPVYEKLRARKKTSPL